VRKIFYALSGKKKRLPSIGKKQQCNTKELQGIELNLLNVRCEALISLPLTDYGLRNSKE